MKSEKFTDKEYEDLVREVVNTVDYHAEILLEKMNNSKTKFPELYFQCMIIYMIDGLKQLDVSPNMIKDHIENHLKGNTYFYSKENNIANKSLH